MISQLDTKTALVLIDLQNGIAALPLFKPAQEAIANSGELVKAFREKGLLVVYINVNPLKDGPKKIRTEKNGLPSTEEAAQQALAAMEAARFFDIVSELEVKEQDLLITKGTWSAFYGTNLHEELQKRNITQIVLAGIATSIGVEGTARAANERGYNIAFAKDAMSDFTEAAHNHSVNVIFPSLGEIDETAAIIEKLNV